MNNAEIQIQFPQPGNWQEFTLTAVSQDAGGYRPPARYTPADIPADQVPAMQAVVSALVGLAEPWQASQVWARLDWVVTDTPTGVPQYPWVITEAVFLTVEAVNPQGGRRVFTARDYPAFVITDPAAVDFFKYFTTPNQ